MACRFTCSAPRRDAPSAFTLLELLLAAALSSVLMLGVMAVVGALGSAQRSAASARPEAAPQEALAAFRALLRADLRHAQRVKTSGESRLTLEGPAALDARGRQRRHRRVRVTYRTIEIGDRVWLVREQLALDAMTNQSVQRDLVASGIDRFRVERMTPDRRPARSFAPDGEPGVASVPVAASRGSGESGAAARRLREGAGASPSAEGEEKASFLYNGVMLYREHLPPAVRRRVTERAEGGAVGGASPGAARGSGDGEGTARPPARGPWRLRVWRRSADGKPEERVILGP